MAHIYGCVITRCLLLVWVRHWMKLSAVYEIKSVSVKRNVGDGGNGQLECWVDWQERGPVQRTDSNSGASWTASGRSHRRLATYKSHALLLAAVAASVDNWERRPTAMPMHRSTHGVPYVGLSCSVAEYRR